MCISLGMYLKISNKFYIHYFSAKIGGHVCDETRRLEWLFTKARQNTLKNKTKAGAPPLPTTSQHDKISLN